MSKSSSTNMENEKLDANLLDTREDPCAEQDLRDISNVEYVSEKKGPEDKSSEFSEDDNSYNIFNSVTLIRVSTFFNYNYSHLKTGFLIALIGVYMAFLVVAMVINNEKKVKDPTPLIIVTAVTATFITIWLVRKHFGKQIQKKMEVFFGQQEIMIKLNILKRVLPKVLVTATVAVIAFFVWEQPRNLVSISGFVFFLFILLICSVHPDKVNWFPVLCGLALSFFFPVLVLKLNAGHSVFKFLGNHTEAFIKFVFGKKYEDPPFAIIMVLPVIVSFGCAISVLYYVGFIQVVIGKIAWVMKVSVGTSAPESLCAVGNIFIGQTEAPIMIRPFLALMTKSELHSVMTGGFATVGVGVLAAYISLGVPAKHLLCASVMNATCALAISKLLYPEIKTSKLRKSPDLDTEEKEERNIMEAVAVGAMSIIKLVAKIFIIQLALMFMLAIVNIILSWFGSFVDCPEFSFQMICSYALMPLAYLMGVDLADCGIVGELIGIKIFLNEFWAYEELSIYLHNRTFCTGRILAVRSEIIATYAVYGFANFSSIRILLETLGTLVPSRRGDLAQIVPRALLGGIVTSLMTACIAGLLVAEPITQIVCLNSTVVNITRTSTLTFVSRFVEQTKAR